MDLWAKEPDAVQGPELRHHHNEFQHYLEDLVISLVVQFLLTVVAYQLLARYRRPRSKDGEGSDDGALDIHSLPFYLCTVALSVAFSACLLVPLTIIAQELLENYAGKWYISWLDADMIEDFWSRIFLATNASLYIIIPFAYFYHETEGFRWRRGVASRLYEASLIFALALVLLLGILYLLWSVIGDSDSFLSFFPFSHLIMSFVGTCVCLGTSPIGFQRIISWSFSWRAPLVFRREAEQRREALELEAQALSAKIAGLQGVGQAAHTSRSPPTSIRSRMSERSRHNQVNDLQRDLQATLAQQASSQRQFARSPLLQNTAAILLTLISLTLSLYTLLRVVWFLIGFLSLGWLGDSTPKDVHSIIRLVLTGSPEGGHLLISLLEVILVIYFMTSAVVGLYHTPGFSSLRPRVGDTPVHMVVLNTALFVLVGSSLPIVLRVLGLTSVDILAYYGTTTFVRQALTIAILRSAFIFFAITRLRPVLVSILTFLREMTASLWVRKPGTPKVPSTG